MLKADKNILLIFESIFDFRQKLSKMESNKNLLTDFKLNHANVTKTHQTLFLFSFSKRAIFTYFRPKSSHTFEKWNRLSVNVSQVSVWQSATLLPICCKSVQTVPARVRRAL